MKKTAVIMAGGRGERFFPLSSPSKPKQFLSIGTADNRTLIQEAAHRVLPLVDADDIFVVTNENYLELVREQLPEIPVRNILCEPVGRNTAPCIGLAAAVIQKRYGDAVMFVLSSDHVIREPEKFVQSLEMAAQIAEDGGCLVTLGITPSYPETGYGYIKVKGMRAEKFVEKPCIEDAEKYFASGDYLWNSGMFVWKTSVILDNFREFLPDMYSGLSKIGGSVDTPEWDSTLSETFKGFGSVSIDYGIMEKAKNIYTVAGDFGWSDVGSWKSAAELYPADGDGNRFGENVIAVGTQDCAVFDGENGIAGKECGISGNKKRIALVGVKNLVVVDTPDALLICDRDCAQDVKKIAEKLGK
ncbi:MAG: mannose-1-phosphate guanylyltransferase [Oscillospiraceae bacterium]|jgi:mannose-1-phosphate guanylyltransferase|nr:mannose-1-phosphate guanylyltransferase [Oscillospiraceae bacterium]